MTTINHAGFAPVVIPADAWHRLRTAGDLLANVALNASKQRGTVLSPRAMESLDECRKEWDAARDAVHQLLQRPSTNGEPGGGR